VDKVRIGFLFIPELALIRSLLIWSTSGTTSLLGFNYSTATYA